MRRPVVGFLLVVSVAATERACPRAYVEPPIQRDVAPPLTLRRVAMLDAPVALAFDPVRSGGVGPDGEAVGVVGEREGRIYVLRGEDVEPEPVIDLSADTQRVGDGGLLGLAYAPDGAWLYAFRADKAKDEVVTAYPVVGGRPDSGASARSWPSTTRPPSSTTAEGSPSGLTVSSTSALATGAASATPGATPRSLGTLLGKVLRIDPTPGEDAP